MNPQIDLMAPGSIVVVEAQAGRARRDHLTGVLERARAAGASTWLLECHRDQGGPWAGLRDLLTEILPAVREKAPDLVRKHDYELALVLPELQRTIAVRNPNLTDLSAGHERTRNYAADRAYRIPHGLVDLLAAWHDRSDGRPWIIACDDFEHAGALVRLFFVELIRRRGAALDLRLIVAAAPGAGAGAVKPFDASVPREHVSLDLPEDPPSAAPDPAEMAQRARELAASLPDLPGLEIALPRLIRYWEAAGDPVRAMIARAEAFTFCTKRGFYEDALYYGESALEALERVAPEDSARRLGIYNMLSNCYSALGRPRDGLAVVEKALKATQESEHLYTWHYIEAMYHARYLPQRDYDRAERALEEGLRHIDRANLEPHVRLFHRAFNRNGLAMIRHFQKRYDEAIALCRASFDELDAELKPHEHQLHRSVLLYNVALVFTTLGQLDEAIGMYTAAIRMDPNYSEYYNERGSLYLKAGRLEEAERDFLRAIELSPPYQEVWTNLGQCYSEMNRSDDAIAAYSRALDLNPRQPLALAGRGHTYDELGRAELAMADYDRTLEINPSQPLVYGRRAALHFDGDRVREALDDLDAAIQLAPALADLYQNRAAALRQLGRLEDAARDLCRYIELAPDAEDVAQVATLLDEVRAALPRREESNLAPARLTFADTRL